MIEKYLIPTITAAFLILSAATAQAQIADSPWTKAADFMAPASSSSQITYGPPGCPVVVIDRDAWHIKSKRIVQTLPVEVEIGETRCLSTNGMYFAAYEGKPNDHGRGVNIWNLVSGEKVGQLPGDRQKAYSVVQIMRNRYLIAANDTEAGCVVWDIEENRKVRDIPTRANRLEQGQLTVSPNGQFLALVEGDVVGVISLAENRYVCNLVSPLENRATTSRYPSYLEADNIEDLEFSPDGQEIAAIYRTFEKQRLVVWDNRGEIQIDIPLNIYWMRLNSQSLSWLPDQQGWIVDGNVIQRSSQKIVTQIKRDRFADDAIGVLDRYYMLGRFGQAAEAVTVVGIPWKEINHSIDAMATAENPIIGPGVQVSITVYMQGKTGDSIEKARAAIGDALTARLAEDQLTYAANQDVQFRFRAMPASIEHKYGILQLELVIKGSDTPLWEHAFAEADSRSFLRGLDAGTISETAVERLKREINLLQVPYFIPRTTDFMPLPLVIQ